MHTGVTGRDLARGALARGNEGSKTMFGSATPVAVHPVHRANAVLRAALLSSTSASDPADDPHGVESLSRAIQTVMQGPVSITFPKSLAERLDALEGDDAFPSFALPLRGGPFERHDPNGGLGSRGGLSASDALSPEAHGLLSLESGWDAAGGRGARSRRSRGPGSRLAGAGAAGHSANSCAGSADRIPPPATPCQPARGRLDRNRHPAHRRRIADHRPDGRAPLRRRR